MYFQDWERPTGLLFLQLTPGPVTRFHGLRDCRHCPQNCTIFRKNILNAEIIPPLMSRVLLKHRWGETPQYWLPQTNTTTLRSPSIGWAEKGMGGSGGFLSFFSSASHLEERFYSTHFSETDHPLIIIVEAPTPQRLLLFKLEATRGMQQAWESALVSPWKQKPWWNTLHSFPS